MFCKTREDAEAVIGILTPWLAERGLALSPEKTRIVHLQEGFDFVSYHVRHYKDIRKPSGWTLLITPSKDAVTRVRAKLKETWFSLKSTPTPKVCSTLNGIVRGWANYHRVAVSSRTFQALDFWMFHRASRWAKFRHPTKSTKWRHERYWGTLHPERNDKWVFGDKHSGIYLLKFAWFNRWQHILVKGRASPDDPTLKAYWRKRRARKAAELNAKGQRLAKQQGYLCPVCKDTLSNSEVLQVHHLLPKGDPRRNDETHQWLVHLMCHQQFTTAQLQRARATMQPAPDHEDVQGERLSVGA